MNSSTLVATYDFRLVALSVVIAICASYVALDLAGRVNAARNNARVAWLIGGAIAMGTGSGPMHYTGMLAYRFTGPGLLPRSDRYFVAGGRDRRLSGGALCGEPPSVSVLHVIVGSLLIASGISGMHYTGMAAMRLPAMHQWDHDLLSMSVAVALIVALAALGLTFLFREEGHDKVLKGVCAVIMGFAVPAMHYTGMAAVSFKAMPETPDLTNAMDISGVANTAIIAVTFVVLGSVFLFNRRFTPAQEPSAAEA